MAVVGGRGPGLRGSLARCYRRRVNVRSPSHLRAPARKGFAHPAVRGWFERRFPEGPTPAQAQGWPHIAARESTLIAAPTGSGKTLAGFLTAIDELYAAAASGETVSGRTQVVYVSPLKALAVDIHQNLEVPLREIAEVAAELELPAPELRVEVRTGDTPPSTRAAMLRHPPNLLVTTPESLYLLVTAAGSRALLRSVRTVIVDEIHAVAGNRRGAHLALTLERLETLCDEPPLRIGLSATQRPVETVAALLVGIGEERQTEDGRTRCAIVDTGHRRAMELAIELPQQELGAVASREQMDEIIDRIACLVREHRTTLVFVNTRRMSERVAHLLAERLGPDAVAAHHGSLSHERRAGVEDRLRRGELRALVATASLELGIDIGPIDLVCQLSTPRSLATFLQRVGRSGHRRGATAVGRLFPMSRDDLVECCALLAGVRAGRLDAVELPRAPLDILAQQIVAECAARGEEGAGEAELFTMARHAAPYASLTRADFEEVVDLMSRGIETGRGAVAAHLHRDRVNHRLHARRGARLTAFTSGGAIPETGDYRVVAEPDEIYVGSVNEDWAVESMAGDIFLLGSTSWRITRVGNGTVRVVDAQGAPPSVPFWLGEAPGRTRELSEEVSALRAGVDQQLAAGAGEGEAAAREVDAGAGDGGVRAARAAAVEWVGARCGVERDVAEQVVDYLAAGRSALGVLPTCERIVVERFFDESGGMQLVVHAPFGARLNRALGLALRKRFCATFDFELQAAASDDAVLLSLGPQHSLPLEDVPRFLSSRSVEEVLRRAVIFAPMFPVRWRWNLNRSLVVPRFKGGRHNPAPIQRLEADDVMVAVFPALAACQNENPTGPIEIPDHLLVRQTVEDCLHEAMDSDSLRRLVEAMEAGTVEVVCRDTTEPSVLAHEIVNGRPYTFLDDAPLEERRSRAVALRHGLPVEARDLAALDAAAIARVRDEVAPAPRDLEELHDLLLSVVLLRPAAAWTEWLAQLAAGGRAAAVVTGARAARGWAEPAGLWCAAECRPLVESMLSGAGFEPDVSAPRGSERCDDPALAAARTLRGHLDVCGPATAALLASTTALPEPLVAAGLARLEAEGFALRGSFDPSLEGEQWCARRLLARIHAYTRDRLRREIEPVSPATLLRFLERWQSLAPGTEREGRAGLVAVVAQLQGVEAPAAAWETEILPRRIAYYRPSWLDDLCLSGTIAWARLRVRAADGDGAAALRSRPFPSRATPLTLVLRADLPWLLQAVRGEAQPVEPAAGASREVIDLLRSRGALFSGEIAAQVRRLPADVDAGLWDAVSRGLVTADGFGAIRSLLTHRRGTGPRARLSSRQRFGGGEGRWSLLPGAEPVGDREALAETVAALLLRRWGVIFWDLAARESLAVRWRDLLWALRRMEARGSVRGGRFVSGFAGEQFALPEAVEQLRAIRRAGPERGGRPISPSDPIRLARSVLSPGGRDAPASAAEEDGGAELVAAMPAAG
jgi:ATP-dependent Lhr-like helicase